MKCPCHSQKEFLPCCGLYITQGQAAPTALALMRSRYTAYCQANVDYLLKTWDPSTRPKLTKRHLLPNDRWVDLKIIATEQGSENDLTGIVEFIAYYKSADRRIKTLHERSQFQRHDGVWYYLKGI